MSYAILRTDKASDQLYAIIQYIAESSGSIDVSLSYLDTLEREISRIVYAVVDAQQHYLNLI